MVKFQKINDRWVIAILGDNFEDLLKVMRYNKMIFSKNLGKVWLAQDNEHLKRTIEDLKMIENIKISEELKNEINNS
jgi:hypothetical protein